LEHEHHPAPDAGPILRVDHDNVIEIVFKFVPVKTMIGATTRIRRIGTLLGSPRTDPIRRLQSFEPVIPDGIGNVARIHPFVDVPLGYGPISAFITFIVHGLWT